MTLRAFAPGSPAWAAVVALLMLATGVWTLTSAPGDSVIVAWWPSVGLAVTLVALTPTRWWWFLVPLVGASTCTANLIHGSSLWVTSVFTFLTMAEAVAGGWILRGNRAPSKVGLHLHRDALRLLVAATAAALVVSLGAAAAALASPAQGISPATALITLFPSHLASVLVVAPALLSMRSPRRLFSLRELTVQLTLLTVAVAVVFAPDQHLAFSSLLLPCLTWAAYRFGLQVVSWQVLIVSMAVSALTVAGYGPFAGSSDAPLSDSTIALLTHAYLVAIALLCLPVAVGVHTADRLHRKLQTSRDLSDMTLATTGCMILVSDTDGIVLRANAAVTTILGHPTETVVGRPIWDTIVYPEHRDLAREMFAAPHGSGVPTNVDGRVADVDGTEHRVMWSSGIVRDQDGGATYIVMTGLDVTAERSAAGLMEHVLGAAIDTAIIGMNPQGRITLFNTGAQKMLGRDAFEGVGSDFTDLLDPSAFDAWAARRDTDATFAALLTHLVDKPPQDWEWRTTQEPALRRVSMALSEIRDYTETLIGYLCVGTDVTETHETAELLVNALEKERQVVGHLKALDSAKDQFVSTVSHELRTPVSTIIGYGEMLSDGALGEMTPRQVKALEAITRNGERLVDLVDNLLALSGMSADGPTWDRDPVDLRCVVDEARTASTRLVAERALTVTFDAPASPVQVLGDRATLLLALNNLVSNAVKFTPDGGQVRCHLDTIDGHARLIVHDTGLGIPKDELPRVFDRFWRSSTAQSREIQGTGLGMPTVLSVITAHGGTVAVDSEHLSGTTVTVLVPLAHDGQAIERASRA